MSYLSREITRILMLSNFPHDTSPIQSQNTDQHTPNTLTRTSTLQSGFQRARQNGCEPGKSAEAEWPSELSGRKPVVEYEGIETTSASSPIRELPLQSKGIIANRDVPDKSDAGFFPCCITGKFLLIKQCVTWVAPRESPLVPMDGGDF